MCTNRRYKWLILLASFLLSVLLIAPLASFGVFYNDLMYTFSTSNSDVSWIASIHMGTAGFGGLLAGPLVKSQGARVSCLIGSLCVATGFLISAFTPNIYLLFVTYGLLSGAGSCILTAATTVIVNEYFEETRAMATALLMSGISTGVFIFPSFARYLTDVYGWRGSMLLHCAVVFHGLALSGLLRPRDDVKTEGELDQNYTGESPPRKPATRKLSCQCSLFSVLQKHPLLIIVGFSSFAENFSFMVNAFFVVPRATSIGIDPKRAAFLLSIKGIGSFCGRLFVILFGDRRMFNRMYMYGLAIVVFGLVTISVYFFEIYEVMAVIFALCGFCPGLATSLIAPILVDLIGIEDLPLTYGYTMACFGASSISSPILAGFLIDMTGEYGTPFLTQGSVTILGGVMMAFIPLFRRSTCMTSKKGTVVEAAMPPGDEDAAHDKCLQKEMHSVL